MKNKILHALSNRRGPFQEPLFSQSSDFVLAPFDSDMEELRQALFLDRTDTDYYLKVYLAVLESQPDLKQEFDDNIVTYQLKYFMPGGVEIDGADFASLENFEGYYTDDPPKTLPVPLTYQIDYLNASSCRLTVKDTGKVTSAVYTVFNHQNVDLLSVNWPTDFPFSGPLVLKQIWQPAASIIIQVSPSQFPYQLLIDRIKMNPKLLKLLRSFSILGEFHGSHIVTEKLAMALTVIGLSNPAVYPDVSTTITLPATTDAPILV